MRTEFDRDTESDDEVDERDGVEADVPETHHTHHAENGEEADYGDGCACSPATEEKGGDAKDGGEGED